jgi:ligand-binding sensor domain-containing protein
MKRLTTEYASIPHKRKALTGAILSIVISLFLSSDVRAKAATLEFDRVTATGSLLIPGPIIQDRDGFLWIGAQGSGVIKYDGYTTRRYLSGSDSIQDDNITALTGRHLDLHPRRSEQL